MGFFEKEEVPPPPDMSGVVNAAKDIAATSADYANQTYDWAKDAVAKNQGNVDNLVSKITTDSETARGMINDFTSIRDAQLGVADSAADIRGTALNTAAKAGDIASQQMAVQDKQLGVEDQQLANQQKQLDVQDAFRGDQIKQQSQADNLYDQYSKTYQPAMGRFMGDAEAYGSPERLAQARAGAAANVGEQFQGARDAATRQLESFGIKPSDTRFAALDLGTRVKEAATKAAAAEKAQRDQEATAFALRDQAIKQGSTLPGAGTAAENAATAIGSNVVGAGNTANAAGNTAAAFGSLANTAGSNAVGATNAETGALSAATGATNAETAANQGANTAQTGALAANTAAQAGEQAAGQLGNQALATETQAIGTTPQYLSAANQGISTGTAAQSADYKNQMDQFKAESTNTTGLGQLLGTAAGVATSMYAPEIKAGIKGLTASAAEGGAIPTLSSPSGGQRVDDVPAQLTAGEFVMPRDVTSWYGEKFLQQLILKAQTEKSKAQAKPAIGPAGPPPTGAGPAIPMGVH